MLSLFFLLKNSVAAELQPHCEWCLYRALATEPRIFSPANSRIRHQEQSCPGHFQAVRVPHLYCKGKSHQLPPQLLMGWIWLTWWRTDFKQIGSFPYLPRGPQCVKPDFISILWWKYTVALQYRDGLFWKGSYWPWCPWGRSQFRPWVISFSTCDCWWGSSLTFVLPAVTYTRP